MNNGKSWHAFSLIYIRVHAYTHRHASGYIHHNIHIKEIDAYGC